MGIFDFDTTDTDNDIQNVKTINVYKFKERKQCIIHCLCSLFMLIYKWNNAKSTFVS